MLRILAVLAALVPALALAQVTAVETSDATNGNDEIINIAECTGAITSKFAFTFQLPSTSSGIGFSQVDLRISNTAGCPTTTENNAATTQSLETFSTNSGSVTNQPSPNIVQLLALKCDTGTLQQIQVCAVPLNGTNSVTGSTISAQIQLDTQTPTPPNLKSTAPGDGALEVSWDAASGANRYYVRATAQGNPSDVHTSGETTDTTKRITGLTNGTTYDVVVVALSRGGNPSKDSNTVPGTPVEVQDFWRLYKNAGGREGAGCATGPRGGGLALIALALLALRRRRS